MSHSLRISAYPLAALTLIALTAVDLAGCGIGPTAQSTFRREIEATDAALVADTTLGNVTVVRGADGRFVVSGRVSAWDLDDRKALDRAESVAANPPITDSDREVRLATPPQDGAWVDFYVEAPAGTRLTLRTASGDVCVRGIDGEIDIDTASGNAQEREAGGSVRGHSASGSLFVDGAGSAVLDTASGDVETSEIEGDLSAHSASGDLRVGEVGGALTADTASGDVAVTSALGAGRTWHVESISGDLSILLPADASFDLDARTVSGEINSRFPVDSDGANDSDRLAGRVGTKGDGRVELVTTSGDISIGKAR